VTATERIDAYAARVREIIPLRFFGESEDCVGAALLLPPVWLLSRERP